MRIQKIYHLGLEELYCAIDGYADASPEDSEANERYTIFREFVTDFLENIAQDAIELELGDSIIFTLTFQGKGRQSPLHSIPLVYNIDAPYTVSTLTSCLWDYISSTVRHELDQLDELCISMLATLVDRTGYHDELNSLFYSADARKSEPKQPTTELVDRTLVFLEQLRTSMINIKRYATVPKDGSIKREIMRLLVDYTDIEYQLLESIRDRLDQLENPK